MDFYTKHLRLFLIITLVMSPIQPLFAMQTGMQTDDSTVEVVAATDIAQKDALAMPDDDCNKHGNCQSTHQCSHCPLSLGIPQIKLHRADLNTQIQFTISNVSLYNTDLLPEYRPPRHS